MGTHPDLAAPSIFSKATALDAKIPSRFHVFSNPSTAGDQLPNLACSYLLPDTEDAYFILSYPSTELLLLKLSADSSPVVANELKGESLMPRFLSGLAEKFRLVDNILKINLILEYFNKLKFYLEIFFHT